MSSMKLRDSHRWAPRFYRFCEEQGYFWNEIQFTSKSIKVDGVFISSKNLPSDRTVVFLHGYGNDCLFPQVGLFKHLISSCWNILQ